MQLKPGTCLQGGKYEILRTLGQGAFGITYLASVKMKGVLGEIRVQVALKEFFAKDLDSRLNDGTVSVRTENSIAFKYAKAFKRESENLSRLKHPGIVNVLEAFEDKGTFYYSMEYLPGGSLDDAVKGVGMPEREALQIIGQIGEALAYMHKQKMMHLDLKPKNIMLKEDGTPVIIDFGLSKQYNGDGEPESSSTIGLGTPGYAPLEQANQTSERTFQPTLDIYALGATLYKMLTGHTPPRATSILNDGFPEQDLVDGGVSPYVITAIERMMSPRRFDRPQSVGEAMNLLGLTVAGSRDEITDTDFLYVPDYDENLPAYPGSVVLLLSQEECSIYARGKDGAPLKVVSVAPVFGKRKDSTDTWGLIKTNGGYSENPFKRYANIERMDESWIEAPLECYYPLQMMDILVSSVIRMANRNLGKNISYAVICIPGYYTAFQRSHIEAACVKANVRTRFLKYEEAAALLYGGRENHPVGGLAVLSLDEKYLRAASFETSDSVVESLLSAGEFCRNGVPPSDEGLKSIVDKILCGGLRQGNFHLMYFAPDQHKRRELEAMLNKCGYSGEYISGSNIAGGALIQADKLSGRINNVLLLSTTEYGIAIRMGKQGDLLTIVEPCAIIPLVKGVSVIPSDNEFFLSVSQVKDSQWDIPLFMDTITLPEEISPKSAIYIVIEIDVRGCIEVKISGPDDHFRPFYQRKLTGLDIIYGWKESGYLYMEDPGTSLGTNEEDTTIW